jgi:hypothetical protein
MPRDARNIDDRSYALLPPALLRAALTTWALLPSTLLAHHWNHSLHRRYGAKQIRVEHFATRGHIHLSH